jgi:Zn-finger nucleic acid-binding protein
MTDATIEPGHLNCPNCTAPMNRHQFESTDERPLEIDICQGCNAIWFDTHESARLSADGVVDLFRFIHSKGGAAHSRLSAKMRCARCRSTLETASDIARNNRFSYYRCTNGHGRLTTFLHFLREKQFVRDLTLAERQKLAAHVRQIKCTSCSGPIDIASHAACPYCGAAVSVLDKEATQKALDHYLQERQRQGRPVPPMAASPRPAGGRSSDFDYLMFDIGTDIVGAFARMAARPSAHAFAAAPMGMDALAGAAGDATLPSLSDALGSAGLGDTLSLVDAGATGSALSGALAGDLGTGLADSVDSFAGNMLGSTAEVVSDSGLVDLVSDGIGAIVEGLFS